jgi:phosphoglycerate dehydrogenase-like enzyme
VRVIFHFAAGPALTARLASLAGDDLDVVACPEHDERQFAALIGNADVLWHVLKPVTSAVIELAPRLRLIQKIGVGVNTIDLDAARRRSIAVCNLPGTNTKAVAEMTLLLMLATLRHLPRFDAALREGRGWPVEPAMQDSLGELGGRTVGLVGYGAVAQMLAPILVALGCRVICAARNMQPGAPVAYLSLDELLAAADIVSLHVPLTPQTELLMNARTLALMRSGAVLINTARGGLVDQKALTEALLSGHLGAAGLDVFVHEPVDPSDRLFGLKNVVLTPHIAWLTAGTFERSIALAAENCSRLRSGRELLFRVA